MRRFNTTGTCFAEEHYMVNIDERVQQIKKMVDRGDYFCINRGRQYGKTTTLRFLKKILASEYMVFSISFEGTDDVSFRDLKSVVCKMFSAFARVAKYELRGKLHDEAIQFLGQDFNLLQTDDDLSDSISDFCLLFDKPVVVIIDEVDQAGNYDSFIKFLGLLRDKYLNREDFPAFHSVILAGVYDIKNLKLKIRPEEQHQYNSPWNIAAQFNVDMDLSESGIKEMLLDYENDNHTGMDTAQMAKLISDYTSGYPFLVSRLCQIIDEDLNRNWNMAGFLEAVKIILNEKNTLFDDMNKKLNDFPDMAEMLRRILYDGEKISYNPDDRSLEIAKMFNFIKNEGGKVLLSNRIFETRMYNYFEFEAEKNGGRDNEIISNGSIDKPLFIKDGHLDMTKIMERFCVHFNEIYDTKDEKFIEKQGRKFFLFFIKPIINGTGNFYVEAQTRDERRMDLVVDYNGDRFVVEMKIWRGQEYNERGEEQLAEYLDYYGLEKGYLLSFCFNKNKEPGIREISVQTTRGQKTLVEAVV